MATAIWGTLLFSSIVSYGAHVLNRLFQDNYRLYRHAATSKACRVLIE